MSYNKYLGILCLGLIITGCQHIKTNKPEAAIQAQVLKPQPETLIIEADRHRLASQHQEAIALYDQLLDHQDHNIALHAKEGKSLCLMQEGKFSEAVVLFQDIIAQDASRWKTINSLAVLLSLSKHYKEAIEYYHIALELSDAPYAVLNNLGLTLSLSNQTKAAIATLEKASALATSASEANKQRIDLNLAMIYGINKQMAKAEEICAKYMSEKELYQNMSFYAQLARNNKLAQKYLRQSLAFEAEDY